MPVLTQAGMKRFGYYVELPRSTIKEIKRQARRAKKVDWEIISRKFKRRR